MKKIVQMYCQFKKKQYLCNAIDGMSYGVMVARQILVLLVKVRVLLRQQEGDRNAVAFFMKFTF